MRGGQNDAMSTALRHRDRCHEVTDEGSSGATVPLPSPSSPPSAELPPKGKPTPLLALPVQGRVPSEARREGCQSTQIARARQPFRLLFSIADTSPYTGEARGALKAFPRGGELRASTISNSLPPLCKGGTKGGLSKKQALLWQQSLSHFVTAPFAQGSHYFLPPLRCSHKNAASFCGNPV